jgi:hypothetical protein
MMIQLLYFHNIYISKYKLQLTKRGQTNYSKKGSRDSMYTSNVKLSWIFLYTPPNQLNFADYSYHCLQIYCSFPVHFVLFFL